MANRNDYNYFDLDNFDDSYDSRSYRRRQQQRMQGSYNRRPSYNVRPGKRRNKRRTRNRIIMVSSAILLVIFFIVMLSMMFKGCSGSPTDNPSTPISTDTKDKQNASNPSITPTEPAVKDELSPSYFVAPQIKDDNSMGEMYPSAYVWKGAAYELFGSTEKKAENYAETINGFADQLTGMTVYDMVIPNHTEMGLPQRLKDSDASSGSQLENIKSIYSKLAENVTPINAYNYLAKHNSEYIYYDSDHHWSGLGAYYAYTAFAESTKQPVLSLESCIEKTIEGFTGSFAGTIGVLNTDTVHYWEFPYDIQMDITDENGTVNTYEGPYYQYAEGGSLTYGVFIMGDHPLTVLKSSSDKGTGKKIAVVKESYGNAFVPYLTYNYEEVHVVDFRHFGQNLKSYCQLNEIDEVLFINGVMSANTQIQLDSMSSLFN